MVREIVKVQLKDNLIRLSNQKYFFEFFCSETSYGFGFKEKIWIKNGNWRVKSGKFEFERRELDFVGCDVSAGFDDLGNYRCATHKWTGEIEVTLSFKVYEDPYFVAVIKVDNLEPQKYLDIDFPMFVDLYFGEDLYLSAIASGIFPIIQIFKPQKALEKFSTSYADATEFLPLWIYDKKNSLVILPLSHFVDYRAVNIKNSSEHGFSMRLSGLNKNKSVEAKVLFYYSDKGPSETLIKAGEILKRIYNRIPVSRDVCSYKYLGYSTANGAFYFNRFNEKTILDVIKNLKGSKIPVRWMQLDFLWHKGSISPKHIRTIFELFQGKFTPAEGAKLVFALWGTKELTPDVEVFPNEFKNLEIPIGLWIWPTRFDTETPYAKKYPWMKKENLPRFQEFWLDIARSFKGYKTVWVETDNLCDILRRRELEGIGEKEKWLIDMIEAFKEFNIPVQLCMTPSVLYPVALKTENTYFIRTGNDFRMRPDSFEIYQNFYNTALAWAFGIYPCFDVFFTSDASYAKCDEIKTIEWGLPFPYITLRDANVLSRVLAHALSCGIIYIGDEVGSADRDMIMRLCLSNGELIRPDRPAITVRSCYHVDPLKEPHPLIVYTTLKKYFLLGVFNLGEEEEKFSVLLEELGAKDVYYSFEYFSHGVNFVENEISETIQPKKCKLYLLCPALGDFAVIGDLKKFIAPYVIESVGKTNDTLLVNVNAIDPVNLGIVSQVKPKEIIVDGISWKEWRYSDKLLEISLGPGKHTIQLK